MVPLGSVAKIGADSSPHFATSPHAQSRLTPARHEETSVGAERRGDNAVSWMRKSRQSNGIRGGVDVPSQDVGRRGTGDQLGSVWAELHVLHYAFTVDGKCSTDRILRVRHIPECSAAGTTGRKEPSVRAVGDGKEGRALRDSEELRLRNG